MAFNSELLYLCESSNSSIMPLQSSALISADLSTQLMNILTMFLTIFLRSFFFLSLLEMELLLISLLELSGMVCGRRVFVMGFLMIVDRLSTFTLCE